MQILIYDTNVFEVCVLSRQSAGFIAFCSFSSWLEGELIKLSHHECQNHPPGCMFSSWAVHYFSPIVLPRSLLLSASLVWPAGRPPPLPSSVCTANGWRRLGRLARLHHQKILACLVWFWYAKATCYQTGEFTKISKQSFTEMWLRHFPSRCKPFVLSDTVRLLCRPHKSVAASPQWQCVYMSGRR